jgi:two-component system sensor histidine kinase MprB
VQIVTADGDTLRQRGETLELPVDERTLEVASGERGGFLRDATVSGTHVRIAVVPYAPGVALQIARDLSEVDDVLSGLRWILLAIALGGCGLAALLGLGVARSALAPTRRLTEAAEEISVTQDLTRRVDTGDRSDELGRLASSFNRMLAALEDSVEAQRRLVADASHELRTPLTSLRTNVAVLERAPRLPAAERRKVLADIDSELEELSRLVADVVDLARDGEQEHAVEDVRLDELVADAVELARRRFPLTFETRLDETIVRGSPERIHRAVSNLLDNAAKWSPEDGTVEVSVAGGRVTVRDHGPGIPDDDLPHVFDRFYRAQAARSLPGSGLGLAIVRQVAESHGGNVTAARADGGGTIVTLELIDTA